MRRLFLALVFISTCVSAEEPLSVSLGLTIIHGVNDPGDDSAPYNRLLRELTQLSGVEVSSKYYSSNRVNHYLDTGVIDCIFPISKGAYRHNIDTIYTDNFNTISSHFFTLSEPLLSSTDAAVGKTIVYIRGYLFANLVFDKTLGISFVPVESAETALTLLKNKRADGYLEYMPDLRFAISNASFAELKTDFTSPIQELEDVMECSNTRKNSRVVNSFNNAITHLKTSGKLAEILQDYYNLQPISAH